MDHSQTINRYRNLLVICILLIAALSAALFQAKVKSNNTGHDAIDAEAAQAVTSDAIVESTAQPLFRIGQQVFSFATLADEFQQPLYQIQKMSFEQQMLVIEQAMIETAIYHGQPSTALDSALRKQFPDISVTDAEVAAYYDQNRDQQSPPFEILRPKLAEYLLSLKYETAKRELLSRLLIEGDAQVLLEAPSQPRSARNE